mmetsp:Transcript_16682/g.46625  ORF Transcript_16682/g.46625 Transcript_16682/m.46625 type:complete len:129 (+) Transcript_16682:192-578(+)
MSTGRTSAWFTAKRWRGWGSLLYWGRPPSSSYARNNGWLSDKPFLNSEAEVPRGLALFLGFLQGMLNLALVFCKDICELSPVPHLLRQPPAFFLQQGPPLNFYLLSHLHLKLAALLHQTSFNSALHCG